MFYMRIGTSLEIKAAYQWRSQVGGSGDKSPPLGLEFTLDISKL